MPKYPVRNDEIVKRRMPKAYDQLSPWEWSSWVFAFDGLDIVVNMTPAVTMKIAS